jgi:hypothetical protein
MRSVLKLSALWLFAFQLNLNTAHGQVDSIMHKLIGTWFLQKSFRMQNNDTISMGPLMVALLHPPFDGPTSIEIDSALNFRIYQSSGGVPLSPLFGKILLEKRTYEESTDRLYLKFQDNEEAFKQANSILTADFMSGYLLNLNGKIIHLKSQESVERIFHLMKVR